MGRLRELLRKRNYLSSPEQTVDERVGGRITAEITKGLANKSESERLSVFEKLNASHMKIHDTDLCFFCFKGKHDRCALTSGRVKSCGCTVCHPV